MTTTLICQNEQVAALTKLTLERHWLYEGRGFLPNRGFRRHPTICLDINGPIPPLLLAALERLEGVDVVEQPKVGRKRRGGYAL